MVLAIDRPAFLVMATIDMLKRFGLDERSAFDIGLQNVRRSKRPILDRALPLRGTHFQVLEEDSYEATRLLFHSDWAAVAQSGTGDLIVGVPAFNAIIFGRARTKQDRSSPARNGAKARTKSSAATDFSTVSMASRGLGGCQPERVQGRRERLRTRLKLAGESPNRQGRYNS